MRLKKRTRLGLINCLLLAAISLNTACAAPASGNLVVIHADDLGWRDLGCMGSPVYETPHIDALAKSGTRFTDAYAAAPICTPSRVALLTGSQPSRHGVYTVVKNRGKKSQWKVIPEKMRTSWRKTTRRSGRSCPRRWFKNTSVRSQR